MTRGAIVAVVLASAISFLVWNLARAGTPHDGYLWSRLFAPDDWQTFSNDGVLEPVFPSPFVSDMSTTFWRVNRRGSTRDAQVAASIRIGNKSFFDDGPADDAADLDGFVTWSASNGAARVNATVPGCGDLAFRGVGVSLTDLEGLARTATCHDDFVSFADRNVEEICRLRSHSSLLWHIVSLGHPELVASGYSTSCTPSTIEPTMKLTKTASRAAGTFLIGTSPADTFPSVPASSDRFVAWSSREGVLIKVAVYGNSPAEDRATLHNFLDSLDVVSAIEWHHLAAR